jgi:hypothetical protein
VANLPTVSTAPTSGTGGVFDTGGKFAVVVNDTGGKFLPPISLMLLIPVANFPPVSLTPVANCQRYQRHWP